MKGLLFYDHITTFGGSEKICFELANRLNLDIVTYCFNPSLSQQVPEGVTIVSLASYGDWDGEEDKLRKAFSACDYSKYYDFFVFIGLFSLFAAPKHHPNIYYGLTALKETFAKPKLTGGVVEKIYNQIYFTKNRFLKRRLPDWLAHKVNYLRWLIDKSFNLNEAKYFNQTAYLKSLKKILLNINKVVFISNFTGETFKRIYRGEYSIVYSYVNVEKYTFKKPSGYWVSINRIHPQKRIEVQLKAFKKLPKEKLFIFGDITDKNYYKLLLKVKSDNVFFVGLKNEPDLAEYLSRAKGLVATSTREAFGMNAVEAMASGKPVIAPNDGGYKETVIDGETGVLIDDLDQDKLVKAIKEVGKNPERYKTACQKRAKAFDKKVFIDKMRQEITKLIENE